MLWPGIVIKRRKPKIQLSHDVDMPSRYSFASFPKLLRRIAGDILIRRDFVSAFRAPFIRSYSSRSISPLDPCNQFDWMMDISESKGIHSAFYFICGRTNNTFDSDYEVEHPAIRDLLRKLYKRGHEIGIHPSFETYLSPTAFSFEAQRLRRVCAEEGIYQDNFGGRMHFLRWKFPETLYACISAQMDYDATLGYADEPGFRCGTCIEYQAYDPLADKVLPLRLRPLIVMEASVTEVSYLGLGTGEEAYELMHNLMRRCELVNGTFSLLWHNSNLITPNQKMLYRRVVLGNNFS